jgi:hypothetical protein
LLYTLLGVFKIMLQLLRFLIFGKPCKHEWKLEQEMKPWNNDQRFLYSCKKCGKMKKVKMKIPNWQ